MPRMKTFYPGFSAASNRCALIVFLIALFFTLKANAAPADLPTGFPVLVLKGKAHGEEAVASLGNYLPAIAAFYHVKEAELKKLLREDKMLWIDERGRLFYVCKFDLPVNAGGALND